MSSPEERPQAEERYLTVIVIPHGEIDSRSLVVSYRRLRLLAVAAGVLLVVAALGLSMLFPVMIQAANARELKRELESLDRERAEIAEMSRTLQQIEERYEQVRQMLGADAAVSGDSTLILPPLRPDTADTRPRSSVDAGTGARGVVDLWPLYVPGYITRALSDGRSQHPGLDIAVPSNTYVRAAGPGRVVIAGVDEVYGQYIILDHGEGLQTVYGHASRLFVTAGDSVERGEVIALSGSSGRSTAPHLHFEVRKNGQAVDPLSVVRQP